MKNSLYTAAGKIFLVAAIITMMSSCSIYRKYHRPEDLPTDSLYRAELVDTSAYSTAEEDSSFFGYMPWEEVFTNPDPERGAGQGPAQRSQMGVRAVDQPCPSGRTHQH